MSGDDGGPATLEPDALDGRAGARVGWAFWTKAAPAFVLAAVLLLVIPLDRTGDTPRSGSCSWPGWVSQP